MKTIKYFTLMLCIAAMGLATACSKDDDSNNNSGSLVGTTWQAGNRYTDEGWATLQFTSATAVTYTEGLREESITVNGTYTYNAPNGTLLFTTPGGDTMHGTFTVNGNTMHVVTGDGINMTFTRQ